MDQTLVFESRRGCRWAPWIPISRKLKVLVLLWRQDFSFLSGFIHKCFYLCYTQKKIIILYETNAWKIYERMLLLRIVSFSYDCNMQKICSGSFVQWCDMYGMCGRSAQLMWYGFTLWRGSADLIFHTIDNQVNKSCSNHDTEHLLNFMVQWLTWFADAEGMLSLYEMVWNVKNIYW